MKRRVLEVRTEPIGIGRQFENAKEWFEPKTIHSQPKKVDQT